METEAPEDNKVLDRLQEYTDEAGDPERMQKISTGYQQSIGAIKQQLTRFGLSSADGLCQVQLDMAIDMEPRVVSARKSDGEENAEEVKTVDTWREKQSVLEAVAARVEKVRDHRQKQFQARRDQIREAIALRERAEAEE